MIIRQALKVGGVFVGLVAVCLPVSRRPDVFTSIISWGVMSMYGGTPPQRLCRFRVYMSYTCAKGLTSAWVICLSKKCEARRSPFQVPDRFGELSWTGLAGAPYHHVLRWRDSSCTLLCVKGAGGSCFFFVGIFKFLVRLPVRSLAGVRYC